MIPHGMPHIEPKGRRRLKAKLGLDGRTIVSTFGLVGPGKGLEYAIEAMPAIAARHPEALYLIAGQTHPELLKQRGEEYRNRLQELVDGLELGDHVLFVNQYLDQKDIIELPARDRHLRHAVPRPQPDHQRHVVVRARRRARRWSRRPTCTRRRPSRRSAASWSTSARPSGIADAVNALLDDPKLKARLEKNAYAYANEATWPKTGDRFLEAMQELVDEHPHRADAQARREAALHDREASGREPADRRRRTWRRPNRASR